MDSLGDRFLARVREIIEEAGKCDSPERAARVAAFAICVMLDGSGEEIEVEGLELFHEGRIVVFDHADL